MAVFNKSTIINRLIDDVGISSQHRSEAVRYLDANFDHASGFLMPKTGGVGTARDALLAFKSARPVSSATPSLGIEGGVVSGVSPVLRPSTDAMTAEQKISYANEMAFRKAGLA